MSVFQTNTFVDGIWTTRTVDADAVLRSWQEDQQPTENLNLDLGEPPVYGLLTKTLVNSPVVHWILPARVRDEGKNDIVFIGDTIVQIRQLQADNHLHDVATKTDFGSRIRNAAVIGPPTVSMGSFAKKSEATLDDIFPAQGTNGSTDIDMPDLGDSSILSSPKPKIPRQFIALVLESGDIIILFARQGPNGNVEFISSRHTVARPMMIEQPGRHLVVDPTSRFMAVACFEGIFALYRLRTMDNLNQHFAEGNFRPIEAERYFRVNGVIHKMEFLHPSPTDVNHVILLLLIIKDGQTRMLLYDWDATKDLKTIQPHGKKGHPLVEANRMPQLLIPLKVKSSFLLISEESITWYTDILAGSPTPVLCEVSIDPPSELHHGLYYPLWASWYRAPRWNQSIHDKDHIYLVREDGVIRFLEIDEDGVSGNMNVGNLDCNVGNAFACLEHHMDSADIHPKKMGDLLIAGGETCEGGLYLIQARAPAVLIEPVANWSPTIDFVTTAASQEPNYTERAIMNGRHSLQKHNPDRIFAGTGQGRKGAISEMRYGLEAHLGLDIPFHDHINRTWAFPISEHDESHNRPHYLRRPSGTFILASTPDQSALLFLTGDATEITDINDAETGFDLKSRTLAAGMFSETVVQITEHSIVAVRRSAINSCETPDELSVWSRGTNILAAIHEPFILIVTDYNGVVSLRLFEMVGLAMTGRGTIQISQPPTSIAIGSLNGNLCGLFASGDMLSILNFSKKITVSDFDQIMNDKTNCEAYLTEEILTKAITYHMDSSHQSQDLSTVIASVAVLDESPTNQVILCGLRNGTLVTLSLVGSQNHPERYVSDKYAITQAQSQLKTTNLGVVPVQRDSYQVGVTPVIITKFSNNKVALCCDDRIFQARVDTASGPDEPLALVIHQIWHTDAANASMQQSPITSVTNLDHPGYLDDGNLLLTSGTRLLMAQLDINAKAIPRHIPVGGSATRLMYSHHLGVIVSAVTIGDSPTLLFIDPDTGNDLSFPTDKEGNPLETIAGLGKTGDKIMGLLEWTFTKEGKTWKWILVTTKMGKILVVETARIPIGESQIPKIRYHTIYRMKKKAAISAIATSKDSIYYCEGLTLRWETLDLQEKHFVKRAEYELPSMAMSMYFKDKMLMISTAHHSLIAFKTDPNAHESIAMSPAFSDQVARQAQHFLPLEDSIILVTDKDSSVTGIWHTSSTNTAGAATIFEAELPASIMRLRTGRTRPRGDSQRALTDTVKGIKAPNLLGSDILGMGIDGSMFQFTILREEYWRLLRFVQNCAEASKSVCPFTYDRVERPKEQGPLDVEPCMKPKTMMHVDGDILARCVDSGLSKFESLMNEARERQDERYKEAFDVRFREVAEAVLEGGDLVWHTFVLLKHLLRDVC